MPEAVWTRWLLPQDNIKQTLRVRRFLVSVGVYCFCLLVVYLSCRMGLIRWEGFAGIVIITIAVNAVLFLCFRTGLNLKMHDPSLTSLQMYIGAVVTMYAACTSRTVPAV